ncbi:hypothetical protein HK101_001705 [Irineochytrium annulatum]|nr:hypothetical protein HK101_001705 [Irineochytrium annulatum]
MFTQKIDPNDGHATHTPEVAPLSKKSLIDTPDLPHARDPEADHVVEIDAGVPEFTRLDDITYYGAGRVCQVVAAFTSKLASFVIALLFVSMSPNTAWTSHFVAVPVSELCWRFVPTLPMYAAALAAISVREARYLQLDYKKAAEAVWGLKMMGNGVPWVIFLSMLPLLGQQHIWRKRSNTPLACELLKNLTSLEKKILLRVRNNPPHVPQQDSTDATWKSTAHRVRMTTATTRPRPPRWPPIGTESEGSGGFDAFSIFRNPPYSNRFDSYSGGSTAASPMLARMSNSSTTSLRRRPLIVNHRPVTPASVATTVPAPTPTLMTILANGAVHRGNRRWDPATALKMAPRRWEEPAITLARARRQPPFPSLNPIFSSLIRSSIVSDRSSPSQPLRHQRRHLTNGPSTLVPIRLQHPWPSSRLPTARGIATESSSPTSSSSEGPSGRSSSSSSDPDPAFSSSLMALFFAAAIPLLLASLLSPPKALHTDAARSSRQHADAIKTTSASDKESTSKADSATTSTAEGGDEKKADNGVDPDLDDPAGAIAASIVKSDPPPSAFSHFIHPIFIAIRFLQLLIIFLPVVILTPYWLYANRQLLSIMMEGADPDNPEDVAVTNAPVKYHWWADVLVWSLERAGPTFIKLGQYASSRTDVMPPSICAVLGRLQSGNRPHSVEHTKRVVAASMGARLEEVFEVFEEKPIGVGAIAQVHRAKLRDRTLGGKRKLADAGTWVAVKVVHPGVARQIEADLVIMGTVASWMDALVPGFKWLSLPDEVNMFKTMMLGQMDMRVEAANLDQFRKNFANAKDVSFPRPIHGLISKELLVEENVDGIPSGKFLEDGRSSVFDETIAEIGIRAFLKMLVVDNFVHADLHPGNILITFKPAPRRRFLPMIFGEPKPLPEGGLLPDGRTMSTLLHTLNTITDAKAWNQTLAHVQEMGYTAHVTFIDAGLVTSLSGRNLANFIDLLQAITTYDGGEVANLMVTRSRDPASVQDVPGFVGEMKQLMTRVRGETLQLSRFSFSGLLGTVFGMVRRHRVRIEGDFANVGIAVMLVEGIGRRLDPSVDLLAQAGPVLRQVRGPVGSEIAEAIRKQRWHWVAEAWFWLSQVKKKLFITTLSILEHD